MCCLQKFLSDILDGIQKQCSTEEIRFAIEKGYADTKVADPASLLKERDVPVLTDEQSKIFSDMIGDAEVCFLGSVIRCV